MAVFIEPALDRWPVPPGGVVATGHQPWLWHPGILAKYMAAAEAAERCGGRVVHLVVDTDLAEGLNLDLPVAHGSQLDICPLMLAPVRRSLPSAAQPPVDPDAVVAKLRAAGDLVARTCPGAELLADLQPLIEAFDTAGRHDAARKSDGQHTLAMQIASVLEHLMQRFVGPMERIYARDLLHDSLGRSVIDAMLRDPRRCVTAYNAAAARFPEAGIRPLHLGVDFAELPLWSISPETGIRRAVFADLAAGPGSDALTVPRETLTPRALLLSGIMRAGRCDLFIHGRGGAVYDQVTESWWSAWRSEPLAPLAMVSADVHLDFAQPQAEPTELARAKWWAHHLPTNIDRAVGLMCERVREKHRLLAHMDDDRDRKRRRAAFRRLRALNAEFATEHAALLAKARTKVQATATAFANRAIARRRDWCFALYPLAALDELNDKVRR